jgi:DNA polymerase-3 subunit gamma/tau
MEQAPGVWLLGSESNVGKHSDEPGEEAGQTPPESAAARYEPAAAQIPRTARPADPAPSATSVPLPAPAQAEGDAHIPAPLPPGVTEPDAPGLAPAYAMASAQAPAARAAAFAASAAPVSQARSAATAAQAAAPVPPGNGKLSLYQRLSNSPEAEAGRAKAPARRAESVASNVQDIPSADDETIEESGVFGRAAVERILGGKLIEERSLDGSPLLPRY